MKRPTTFKGSMIGIQIRLVKEELTKIKDMYRDDWNRGYVERILEGIDKHIDSIWNHVLDMELEQ